jgi:5-methylcytosine-specific restriction endonuclease McrBC regulatory subunit McrC
MQKGELEKRCKDLRNELKTKEREWAGQVNKLVTANREILGKNGRYNNKVPDEKIKELFGELKFKIGQFTNKYPKQLPEALEKELDPIWEGFTPNARKFLKNCALSNLLFESYIWEWLRTTVFVQDSKVWGGDLGESLSEMMGRARGKSTHF